MGKIKVVNNSLRAIFLSLIIFTIFLFYALFISMIGESAIDVPFASQSTAISIIPQGWSFFTRDPREEKVFTYQVRRNQFFMMDLSASSPKYIFGLDRKGRTGSLEIQNVLHKSHIDWKDFENNNINNINIDSLKCDTVLIKTKNSILKGEILFQQKLTVPWAWSSSKVIPSIPYKVKLIYVKNSL